jgi:TolA-binding protein
MHKKMLSLAAAVLLAIVPHCAIAEQASADPANAVAGKAVSLDLQVLFAKAYDLFSRGLYADSSDAFSELAAKAGGGALAVDSDYLALLSLVNAGKAAEAGKLAESMMSRYPDSAYLPEIEYQRVRADFMLGRYEAAAKGFERFMQEYPEDAECSSAKFWRAESLLALGRGAEAFDEYLDLLGRFPGSPKRDAASWRLESLGSAARAGREQRLDGYQKANDERFRAAAEAAEPRIEQRRERAGLLIRTLRGAYGMQGGWSLPLYADMNAPGLPAAAAERQALQAQADANAMEALRVSRLKELLAAKAETLRLLALKLEQFAAEVSK